MYSAKGQKLKEDEYDAEEDTISTSLTWNWDMNGWNGYTRVSHLYSSEAILLENPVAQAIIESQGNGFRKMDTLNFSAGVEKDNLSISLYGQNVNAGTTNMSGAIMLSEYLKEKSKKRKITIKDLIMNQQIVVGIGNIYATESLLLSKISIPI